MTRPAFLLSSGAAQGLREPDRLNPQVRRNPHESQTQWASSGGPKFLPVGDEFTKKVMNKSSKMPPYRV